MGNRRDDGEAEASTAAIGVAGLVEPPEPAKDEISVLGGDTSAIVVDMDPGVPSEQAASTRTAC